MVTEGQAQIRAEHVLKPHLSSYGLSRVSVQAGYDRDGDASFFVDAYLAENVSTVDGPNAVAAIGALREALSERNDLRFPYLSFKKPSDDLVQSEMPA